MTPTRRDILSALLGGGAVWSLETSVLAGPTAEDRTSVLRQLLAKNHGLRPEFGPGYSNHVSMGLFALMALGGNARQLGAFAEKSWRPLEPLSKEAGPTVRSSDISSLLGQRAALNGYRSLFEREVRERGRDGTFQRYLPVLLPGLGAAAFHPLIRTGYGVRFGDDQEVSDGLAYWATAYLSLGELGASGTEPEPRALLDRLRAARTSRRGEQQGGLILDQMRNASRVPEFAPTVAALQPREDTLRKLAAVARQLYLATGGNFTALHAVTGTHGLRMLLPHIRERDLAVRYLWQALVAAYLTVGTPALSSERTAASAAGAPAAAARETPDWSQIVAKVVSSTDAHDLKLVDVAREEGAFYREPEYRRAAALRLRLV